LAQAVWLQMIAVDALSQAPCRRFALVLGNGAYTQKAPLSKTVGTAVEMQRKLITTGFQVVCATDQDLAGMRSVTLKWLELIAAAADSMDLVEAGSKDALVLFFVYCGHGGAGRLYPVDASKRPPPEETFCFFEDFLFKLYDVLSFNCRLRPDVGKGGKNGQGWQNPGWEWRRWPAQVVSILESCRRLSKDEKEAYEQQRACIANGRRHLLPSVVSMKPELASMGGAE